MRKFIIAVYLSALLFSFVECNHSTANNNSNEMVLSDNCSFTFLSDTALADSLYCFINSVGNYRESKELKWGMLNFNELKGHLSAYIYITRDLGIPTDRCSLLGSFNYNGISFVILCSGDVPSIVDTSVFSLDEAYKVLGEGLLYSLNSDDEACGIYGQYDIIDDKWVKVKSSEIRMHPRL